MNCYFLHSIFLFLVNLKYNLLVSLVMTATTIEAENKLAIIQESSIETVICADYRVNIHHIGSERVDTGVSNNASDIQDFCSIYGIDRNNQSEFYEAKILKRIGKSYMEITIAELGNEVSAYKI